MLVGMSRVEEELIESQVDILGGKFDMVVRVGRNTARLLNGVRTYRLTIFRGHGRGIDLLVKESGYIGTGPISLLILNRRLKVIGVFDVELEQFGHIGRILASLSRSIFEILQYLLVEIWLFTANSDNTISIFASHFRAARSKRRVVERNGRSGRRIEPGFFGPVVLPFKGDLFTAPQLAYEVNSF